MLPVITEHGVIHKFLSYRGPLPLDWYTHPLTPSGQLSLHISPTPNTNRDSDGD